MPKLDVVQQFWDESIPFKQKCRSVLYMWVHPIRCLRLFNYATKTIIYFEVKTDFNIPDEVNE